MTREELRSLRCPECALSVEAHLVSVLDAQESPELVESLFDGTFGQLACPSCGASAEVEPELLYVDAGQALAVQLLPAGAEDPEVLEEALAEKEPALAARPELLRRQVPTRLGLVAQVLAREAGLDDRVLAALGADLQFAHPELAAESVHFAQDAGDALVFVLLGEAGARRVRVARTVYDELAAELSAAALLPPAHEDRWRHAAPESGRALLEALAHVEALRTP